MNPLFAVSMTVLLGLFYCWTSRINGLFFFGRTVAGELQESVEGRAITREYRMWIALTTLAAAAIAWAGGHARRPGLGVAGILFECVAFSFVFARANGRVRRLEQIHAEWSSTGERLRQVSLLQQPEYWVPDVAAILMPLAVCAVALGTAVLAQPHAHGLAGRWTATMDVLGSHGYSGLLGLSTGMMVAAVAQLLAFRSSARLRTRMAQYTVRACLSLEWIAAVLLAVVLGCGHFGVAITHGVSKGIILAALLAALGVLLWNQWRAKRFVPAPVELGADDRWLWGLFYVDRDDPALFVQSRCGAGYTLNYGRVAAWPISLCIVAYLVGVMFFLPVHR